jgi:hypothetical protein
VSLRIHVPPSARSQLGKAAALDRHHPEGVEQIADAKRSAKFLTLEDYIQRTVDAAPALTPEQKDRLAGLLRPVPSAGDAA